MSSIHAPFDVAITNLNATRDSGLGYDALVAQFRIELPARFNMAASCVGRHATGPLANQAALVVDSGHSPAREWTYAELNEAANRVAVGLAARRVGRGDVVLVYCAQGFEAALAHLACYKLGAIVAPLSLLYGPDTVRHILRDSGARVLIAEREGRDRLGDLAAAGVTLREVIVIGAAHVDETSFTQLLAADASRFAPVDTAADDPALLLYTSGSTGLPKGILHRHSFILGYLASVALFNERQMGEPGQRLWTPSDWSWIAGIVNVMMTGWYYGQTVIAGQGMMKPRFSPEGLFDFVARQRITHTFLTPTALKRMTQVVQPRERWPQLALRVIGTGGEPLPGAVLDWGRNALGVPINEFYGLTEVNHMIGNSSGLFPVKPGSMGRAYPGHTLAILDEAGLELPDGEPGEIAARDDDPTLFIGYWNQPARTASARTGRWVRTGDVARRDADGYFWYLGRTDDLIKSAGYRIGPAEVEEALLRHAAVAEAAVIGRPDADRGQVVCALVRLVEGATAGTMLARMLQDHVAALLGVFKAPRVVEFVEVFPLTTTGKISRKTLREGLYEAPR